MAVLVALAAAGLPSMVGEDECATARSLDDGMSWSWGFSWWPPSGTCEYSDGSTFEAGSVGGFLLVLAGGALLLVRRNAETLATAIVFGVSGLTAWMLGLPLGFLPAVVIALLVTRSWRATVVAAGVFVVRRVLVVLRRGLGLAVGSRVWPWWACRAAQRLTEGGRERRFRRAPALSASELRVASTSACRSQSSYGHRKSRGAVVVASRRSTSKRSGSITTALRTKGVTRSGHLCSPPSACSFPEIRKPRRGAPRCQWPVSRRERQATRPCHAEPRRGCSSHAAGWPLPLPR